MHHYITLHVSEDFKRFPRGVSWDMVPKVVDLAQEWVIILRQGAGFGKLDGNFDALLTKIYVLCVKVMADERYCVETKVCNVYFWL